VNSPLSILEIAGRVGYSDIKNFFRVFKKQYGQSPQRYRQNQTGHDAN
ncbi:MAG: helix-turn-helix domain-containing protein, partial [Clostridiaceae bacterium]|nr:helix-turn-helix domain-containing protein [Clostridiaceae bacterium]